MSHYAKVVNDTVVQVIVCDINFFNNFIDTSPGEWINTSYQTRDGQHPDNKPLRQNYAGIGYLYDREKDIFIPPSII